MSYQITVLPSNLHFTAEPGELLLEAALRQGVLLPYGCKNGGCGACTARVISGEVGYANANVIRDNPALPETERAKGMTLLCSAVANSDIVLENPNARFASSSTPKLMPARVDGLNFLSSDVLQLVLRIPANEHFQFQAGQYIDIILKNGERRSYSIANAPQSLEQEPLLHLHIRRQAHGLFSDVAFSGLKVRDMLRIHGPHGSFTFQSNSSKPVIFVASGTGFAPIKSIIEWQLAQPISMQRPSYLYWGGRQLADLYMHQQVSAWATEHSWLHYIPVLSEPQAQDNWQGRSGFVHHAVMADFPDLSKFEVYACGAPVVVNSAKVDFTNQCQLPEQAFFSDAFTPATTPG